MKFALAGYGGRGDIEPCAAVGRELLRRGHEVRMAVPPNMLGLVESAGLAAVAYGPGTQEQINTATDFLLAVQNPIGKLREVMDHVGQIWAEKGATLMSLAKGADLLLAGMSEQGPAANIAEYYGIPLAALHFFPAQVLISSSGWLYSDITKEVADAQRRALGSPSGR
jgi:UDP:flavonoid glycosyltransferase YjiC (YdhE family)